MELRRFTGSFSMHRVFQEPDCWVFFPVAVAILSHVFLRKPQNNLVSVLLVYHIKCSKAGIFWENSRGNFGRLDWFFWT